MKSLCAILFFFALTTSFLRIEKSPPISDLTNGLVLHYPFNGNSLDISGNNNHGLVSGAFLTKDRKGNYNSAYSFDGIDDVISFDYHNSFSDIETSISCWIYVNEFGHAVLANDIVNDQEFGVWMSIGVFQNTLNRISINYGNGGHPNPASRKTFVANKSLEKNIWYHVVGVISSLSEMKIYINGKDEDGFYTGTSTNYIHSGGGSALGRTWHPTFRFNGKLDDIRIFDRPLADIEIEALYNE